MLEIVQYNNSHKAQWDEMVKRSKNGTFLFYRDYMDYHSDRFADHSFLLYWKGKLEAVIPGNIEGETYFSHQGLTYGGLLMSSKLRTVEVVSAFDLINQELKKLGVVRVVYKPVPYIYHKLPAQEDIYALLKYKARKVGCNISSTIFQDNKLRFIESRKSGLRKSKKMGVRVEESDRLDLFWPILNDNLTNKYSTSAVHTLEEMVYLQSNFPDNIKLYLAIQDDVVAGTVIYVMDHIVHVQYISATEYGKFVGALDLLFDELINKHYLSVPIFDFGQSTENMGLYLNENLIFQKEGFGGRGVVYDVYEYNVTAAQ